uniref:Uncharacterized protein n=1 Tax=viral metagenome TaxID=1070528 RepID=A0A6M3XTL7_9ZZZZ
METKKKCYCDQIIIRTCEQCKPFRKFGTIRLEKLNEKICSVCGKIIFN